MEDRILMREGKPQIYSTQVRKDRATGIAELYEVIEPEYLDVRRAEAGFMPINDYLSHWGITFDLEQKSE